ncbi:MAG: hypothetical protein WCA98_09940 [Candidatus Acidiferrales bacterium]
MLPQAKAVGVAIAEDNKTEGIKLADAIAAYKCAGRTVVDRFG